MKRVPLVGSITFVKQCKGEEKCEENGAIFRNTYLINYWMDFLQTSYVELYTVGIKKSLRSVIVIRP